jgi:hypothetical protein
MGIHHTQEAPMRTAKPPAQPEKARHLSENLMTRLTQGKEWATPGVEAALQRAVAGLDTGIESASPRVQAALRRIADELAGGVETLTPRVHEGLKRVAPKGAPAIPDPGPAEAGRPASRKAWFIVGMLAVAVSGAVAWRSLRTPPEDPVSPVTVQTPTGATPDADTAPAEAGI